MQISNKAQTVEYTGIEVDISRASVERCGMREDTQAGIDVVSVGKCVPIAIGTAVHINPNIFLCLREVIIVVNCCPWLQLRNND